MTIYKNAVCRGSWLIGNNCQICERCIETKPKFSAQHETRTGPMDKITQSHRMLIEAIINDHHTTRLDSDYVPHILSKVRTQDAFTRFERDILATRTDATPVAWMYEKNGSCTPITERAEHMIEHGWTETPLYAHPPAPVTAPDVDGLVQADDATERVARALCIYEGRNPDAPQSAEYPDAPRWFEYRGAALAAIAAMKGPKP